MKNGWIEDGFGIKRHYLNDELHNENGPAYLTSWNGNVRKKYFLNNEMFTEKEFNKIRKNPRNFLIIWMIKLIRLFDK